MGNRGGAGGPTTEEKRHHPRVPLVAKIAAEAAGRTFTVEARNISLGGMLIRTDSTLPENHSLRLRFTLPGNRDEIAVNCRVQHVSPGAFMGVRFEGLTAQALAAIEKYVKRLT